jgi:UDP-GlcNAc3NAcA epimerase
MNNSKSKMRIATIIGARPQFIKAAVISRIILKIPDLSETIIHTGQHYDTKMSDVFFEELDIPTPDVNLNVQAARHGAMTGRMLEGIEEVLIREKPDLVLVYGDTNSTVAGALAAAKLDIPVAHVEAGVRSFNRKMPEEVNRVLTDHISDILFAPTESAVNNLKKEGLNGKYVKLVGDVMLDSAILNSDRAKKPSPFPIKVEGEKFILATFHRAENTDDTERLTNIVTALNELSENNHVIVPLHPRTQEKLKKNKLILRCHILEPVSYLEMIWLLKHCCMVLTDSGGLQKEAFFFKRPCLTLRDETEWVELKEDGSNILVGTNQKTIVSGYKQLHGAKFDYSNAPYGIGNTGNIVVKHLCEFINENR